jgi:hypothetical protein
MRWVAACASITGNNTCNGENVNTAPYRVLLEIGDNGVSKAFLQDPVNQKKIGEAIKRALAAWLAEKGR